MARIYPTVGCKVSFNRNGDGTLDLVANSDQAFDTTVVHFNDDCTANLLVTDHVGRTKAFENVTLLQDGYDDLTSAPDTYFAYWTPSAKAEVAQESAPIV